MNGEAIVDQFQLSWNLRNNVDPVKFCPPDLFGMVGSKAGEYPIEDFEPYFLEVPRNNGMKKILVGRMNRPISHEQENTKWDFRRVIRLPHYINEASVDMEMLKLMIKYWRDIHISEDIPVLALAVKYHGNYSDVREAKRVHILLVWNDGMCRISTLEWFEGPEEDCITPEWYINNSDPLGLQQGIQRMRSTCNACNWDNPVFSIFTLPSNMTNALPGEAFDFSNVQWNTESKYRDHQTMMSDLETLFSQVQYLFSIEEVC